MPEKSPIPPLPLPSPTRKPTPETQTERHALIVKMLEEQGKVSVQEMSQRLSVSEVTIRKDLKILEDTHRLYRTHGGAHQRNPYARERPVAEKAAIRATEKERIGKAAADLVRPRDAILLASGTTVFAVANQLKPLPGLTVITSALPVALELARIPEAEILVLGGQMRHSSGSVIGSFATAMLADYSLDKLFIGVDGFDMEFGLTTSNAAEAELNRAMIAAAQRTIVVTDSTKFGRRSFRRICGLEDVDLVITDQGVDPQTVAILEEMGIEVRTV